MNNLSKLILKHYLPKLIKNKCEARIPRSGEKGKRTNCYIVFLNQGSNPHLVIEGFHNDKLTCLKWDGKSFSEDAIIDIQEIDNLDLEIEHFFGLDNITYTGIYNFLIDRLLFISFIKIYYRRIADFIAQSIFNKRSLQTRKRFDFLKSLIKHFIGRDNGFGYVEVMSAIYSNRSFLHPHFHTQASLVTAYLDGFVDTNELERRNGNYFLTGHALKVIDEYEEQDRKHRSATRIQWIMIFLTLALVIFTMVQANLIKVPTIYDLTKLDTGCLKH